MPLSLYLVPCYSNLESSKYLKRKAAMVEQSRFVTRQRQQLIIREKIFSLSGDSFSIKSVDGGVVFRVDGDVLSLSNRMHVRDANRNKLFDIRKKLLTLHTAFFCEDTQDKNSLKSSASLACVRILSPCLQPILCTNRGG
jgi:hypothetical protein